MPLLGKDQVASTKEQTRTKQQNSKPAGRQIPNKKQRKDRTPINGVSAQRASANRDALTRAFGLSKTSPGKA